MRPANLAAARAFSSPQTKRRSKMTKLSTEQRDELDKGAFAFPKERKEPLENASHVRNAIARFNQVKGVSDDERDSAWKRIEAAAKKFGVEVNEKSWREIGKG
jgi:ribosome recycling factor